VAKEPGKESGRKEHFRGGTGGQRKKQRKRRRETCSQKLGDSETSCPFGERVWEERKIGERKVKAPQQLKKEDGVSGDGKVPKRATSVKTFGQQRNQKGKVGHVSRGKSLKGLGKIEGGRETTEKKEREELDPTREGSQEIQ